MCARANADGLDPARLDGLVHQNRRGELETPPPLPPLVTDHETKKIVPGTPGKDTVTLDAFFDQLGSDRAAALEAMSMDMRAPERPPSDHPGLLDKHVHRRAGRG